MGYEYIKVLLYAYPKLEELSRAVAEGARVKAMLSFRGTEDTCSLAERIAEEMARSEQLLFLKRKMDVLLAFFTDEELFLLEYKYFRRRKVLRENYGEGEIGCSLRSYFRRQNALLKKISRIFPFFVMTEENFLREMRPFPSFIRMYNALLRGEERKVVGKRGATGLRCRSRLLQNSAASGVDGRLPRRTNTAIAAAETPRAQRAATCAPVKGEECGSSSVSSGGSGSGAGAR